MFGENCSITHQRADLVGGLQLPETAFKGNAKTEVLMSYFSENEP